MLLGHVTQSDRDVDVKMLVALSDSMLMFLLVVPLISASCGARVPSPFPPFPLVHLLHHLLFFYFFLSFIGFTYFLLLSIPSLSTRIVPLRFQAGGRRKRPNLGLVCFVCVSCIP